MEIPTLCYQFVVMDSVPKHYLANSDTKLHFKITSTFRVTIGKQNEWPPLSRKWRLTFLKIQFLATKEPWIWNRQHFNVLFPWQKRIRCCICIALAIANWWVHKEFTKSNHKNFLREKSACLNKANSIALNWACSAFLPLFCRLFVSSSPYSTL